MATGGMCCQLTGATSYVSATSVELLPFPPQRIKLPTHISPYIMPKIRRHLSGEMRLTQLPEAARPRRLVDVLSSHRSYFRCISDICRATFVSGVGDPSPDSYIAVSNANNTTSLVGGNASHAATGSRPTTSTSGVCCQLTGATSDVSATSVQLLPFPA